MLERASSCSLGILTGEGSSVVDSLLILELGMARDRNVTVWQAYVIVMSIVSVLSLGWLFFILFTSGTNQRTAETALKDKRTAEENLRAASNKNQLLASMLGAGTPISDAEFEQLRSQVTGDVDIDAAAKSFTNHMVLFGPGATEKSYVKLVDNLMQQLRRHNVSLIKIQNDSDNDRKNFNETIKRETELRMAAQKEKDEIALKAQADLEGYTDKITKQVKLYDELQAEKVAMQQQLDAKIVSLNQTIAQLKKDKDEVLLSLASVNRKLAEVRNESFEVVQGEITDVIDGNVWINRGRADGLKAGVTFVVTDSDVNLVANAKSKAKVEVVELIGTNGARAKIIEDRAYKPILRGDKIYSDLWQPGAITEIALVGKMDIDGDGRDDRQRLISLIEQNNAKVVFDLPEGQRMGRQKLSPSIRFLVLGGEVKVRTTEGEGVDQGTQSALQDRKEIEVQARELNISTITLNKLVNRMQFDSSARSLGSNFRPSVTEYSKPPSNPYQTGKVSELYQSPSGKINPGLKKD
ncbi:MAG: hypothetical protein MUC43_12535 [Pirellula sp.]|jgi:hypothetical protein|nr:hypothetical protein [Pirellula sp.]